MERHTKKFLWNYVQNLKAMLFKMLKLTRLELNGAVPLIEFL